MKAMKPKESGKTVSAFSCNPLPQELSENYGSDEGRVVNVMGKYLKIPQIVMLLPKTL